MILAPGRSRQSNDEGLQQASDVRKGVFAGKEEVEERQQDEAMHKQTSQDGDEVHAQFLSQVGWVVHVQDLPCDQEHYAKGEVPAKRRAETLFSFY